MQQLPQQTNRGNWAECGHVHEGMGQGIRGEQEALGAQEALVLEEMLQFHSAGAIRQVVAPA